MKKLIWLVLLAVSTVILIGCEPTDFDITSTYWRSWGEGEITAKEFVKHPNNDNKRIIRIKFKSDDEVLIGTLYESDKVKIGQTGHLYKYIEGSYSDHDSWFRWIPTTDYGSNETYIKQDKKIIKLEKDLVLLKAKARLADKLMLEGPISRMSIAQILDKSFPPRPELSFQKYEWKPTFRVLPENSTTVLIKLRNGIVTTAYVHNSGDWKHEIYKKQFSGGISISNVVEWKEIDLD